MKRLVLPVPPVLLLVSLFLVTWVAEGCNAPASPPETASGSLSPTPAPGEPTLDELREGLARFRDIDVALAEGYMRDPADHCVTAEEVGLPAEAGAMGVHYLRMDLLQFTAEAPRVDGVGTHTDFRTPSVLLYEPQADGSMALVGVENLAFAAAWEALGHDGPPTFHGVAYDHMADNPNTELDEAHGFMPHFDRHVWVFRENPNGVFEQFNPAVTCLHHAAAGHH